MSQDKSMEAARMISDLHPIFGDFIEEELKDWEGTDTGWTVIFANLAFLICKNRGVFNDKTLCCLASIIEYYFANGNEATSTDIATGFLEAIDHIRDEHEYQEICRLIPYLGPKCRSYIDEYNEFWGANKPIWPTSKFIPWKKGTL